MFRWILAAGLVAGATAALAHNPPVHPMLGQASWIRQSTKNATHLPGNGGGYLGATPRVRSNLGPSFGTACEGSKASPKSIIGSALSSVPACPVLKVRQSHGFTGVSAALFNPEIG